MSISGQVAGSAPRRVLLITAAALARAGVLTGCILLLAACASAPTAGTFTPVTATETPSAAATGSALAVATAAPSCPADLVPYAVAAPRGYVCAAPEAAPAATADAVSVNCILVYQGHNAAISFTGTDALGWCDRIPGSDGHWFRAAALPASGGPLCHGSTDAGGYWEVRDSGGATYGQQACVLLNQLGLRQPLEN